MANLAPFHPSLGVFSGYAVSHPTTLVLKEKAFTFSGDDFSIKDINGYEVIRCHGRAFSLSDKKEFTDAMNRPLFTLRTELFSLRKTFNAESPDGRHLFTVKGKFSFGGTKMIASFINASDGSPIELLVTGDFFDRAATITLNGRDVAQVSRSRQLFNAREIFTGQQTYHVTVAPGVDLALIAAICICLDEKANEN